MRVAVEVCVTSVAEARAAAAAGADTVELCTWLDAGGVTPSAGLVQVVRAECALPVRVLVRPNGGVFQYSPEDRAVLEADLAWAATTGVSVVTGALDGTGLPEEDLLRTTRALLPAAELTFHRAIDHAADLVEALQRCRAAGWQRVLTSGGRDRAIHGVDGLRALVQAAGDAVQIAAAGGITPENVVAVVEQSGAREVHFAAQRRVPWSGGPALSSAATAATRVLPDQAKIEGVLNALTKAGLR